MRWTMIWSKSMRWTIVSKKLRWNVINEVDNMTREELMSSDYVIICFKPITEINFKVKSRLLKNHLLRKKRKIEKQIVHLTRDSFKIIKIKSSWNAASFWPKEGYLQPFSMEIYFLASKTIKTVAFSPAFLPYNIVIILNYLCLQISRSKI